MRMKFELKFHPIGQGLFYSSSIELDKISANVVFDCGSDNIKLINNEIDQYGNKDIDILIISHFHYDHISGLEYLLQNRTVNTVILPYLLPEERRILWLFNYNKPDWYKRFLENPYYYLNKNENVQRIIIINGDNDNDNDGHSINLPDEFPSQNEEKNIQINLENVNHDIRIEIQSTENIKIDDKKILLKKDQGYILLPQSFLAFFNYKALDDKLNNFYKKTKELGIENTETLLSQLKEKDKQELIKESYKIIAKDLNITSLAAYQGFVLPFKKREHFVCVCDIDTSRDCFIKNLFCNNCDCFLDAHFRGHFMKDYKCKFYFHCFSGCQKHCHCSKIIGALLLGDIKLNYKTSKRKEMFTHFKELLPSVNLIQLSHHGAENGWDDELIDLIQGSSIYIAVHGTNNKYNHPHKNVLLKLAASNRKYTSVTEKNEYHHKIEFIN